MPLARTLYSVDGKPMQQVLMCGDCRISVIVSVMTPGKPPPHVNG
jgi:hypothetical protein